MEARQIMWKWIYELLMRWFDDGGWVDCPTCKGTGFIDTSTEPFDLDVPMMAEYCKTCDGSGIYYIPSHQEMG